MPVYRQASDAAQGDVKLEAITQPIYDNQTITTGASTVSFFQNPSGRDYTFTNLDTAGALTWPKRFSIKAFRIVLSFAALAQDQASFYSNGNFVLRVGEKNYFVCPLFLLTPGVGLEVYLVTGAAAPTAPATGVNYATNGWAEHRNIYILQHAVWLPSVQNFRGIVTMESTNTLSASQSVWIMLEGELFREIQ
jgi:hypothetical protein